MSAGAAGERRLIVNADDFGLTSGINRGIAEAHEHGVLTSASLMVRYRAAAEAATYARAHPQLSVGLHFDAAEWRYTSGEWQPVYEVVNADDPIALAAELERQLREFDRLLQQTPTHLDSHQHMHLSEPARTVLTGVAARLNVPLRSCTPRIAYCGGFYGQTGEGEPYPEGISPAHLECTIERLPPGWTELGCHPGYADGLASVYAAEREQELRVLCSPEIRDAISRHGICLCSFHDFRG